VTGKLPYYGGKKLWKQIRTKIRNKKCVCTIELKSLRNEQSAPHI
jgi:hypothetical protein